MVHFRLPLPSIPGVLLLTAFQSSAADSTSTNVKVDRALRDAVRLGAPTLSVIISVKPGYRDVLRQALEQHGDVITQNDENNIVWGTVIGGTSGEPQGQ